MMPFKTTKTKRNMFFYMHRSVHKRFDKVELHYSHSLLHRVFSGEYYIFFLHKTFLSGRRSHFKPRHLCFSWIDKTRIYVQSDSGMSLMKTKIPYAVQVHQRTRHTVPCIYCSGKCFTCKLMLLECDIVLFLILLFLENRTTKNLKK